VADATESMSEYTAEDRYEIAEESIERILDYDEDVLLDLLKKLEN
jgi:hypothetical protein